MARIPAMVVITGLAIAVYFIVIWLAPNVYRAYIIYLFGGISGFLLCKYIYSAIKDWQEAKKRKAVIKNK